jgi:hypothetical protein
MSKAPLISKQAELVFDDFAYRLEKEIALMILPTYGDSFKVDGVRALATRIARLASRRARDEHKIPDFFGNTSYCPNCACRSCELEKQKLASRG